MKSGYIVLAHGSNASVSEANQIAFEIAAILRQKSEGVLIETAILNRDSGLPGIEECVERLVAAGVEEIIIAPLFLSGGMHIRSGIPEEIARLQARYPMVPIRMTEPLGADPRLADILLDRIRGLADQNE
ncbi:MAG: CbiX protein [Firmicutes bacterium]|nr:CbiX protein [Bacillota bacterium]